MWLNRSTIREFRIAALRTTKPVMRVAGKLFDILKALFFRPQKSDRRWVELWGFRVLGGSSQASCAGCLGYDKPRIGVPRATTSSRLRGRPPVTRT